MEQFTAGPREEIQLRNIRKRIYRLREIGYNIYLVSFDSWQSADSIQILKDSGIKAELLSIDRNPEAYYNLKAAILEKRIDYYPYPTFLNSR